MLPDPRTRDSYDETPAIGGQKTYQAPALTCFGSVRTFTQGGSSGANEQASMLAAEMTTSDRRLKENIVRVGDHDLGVGLYLFDYVAERQAECGQGRQFGVMADEVEAVLPAAVGVRPDGYKVVDYAMLGLRRAVG